MSLQLKPSFRLFRRDEEDDDDDDNAVNNNNKTTRNKKQQRFRGLRHHLHNRWRGQVGGMRRIRNKFHTKKQVVYRLDDYMTHLILNGQWNRSVFRKNNNGTNQYEIQLPEYCNTNKFNLLVCQDDTTNLLSVRTGIYTCHSDHIRSTAVLEKALELNYFGGNCNKGYTIAMHPISSSPVADTRDRSTSFSPADDKKQQTPPSMIFLTLCLSLPMTELGSSSSKDNHFCELMNDFMELAFTVKNQLHEAAESSPHTRTSTTSLSASPPESMTVVNGNTKDNTSEPKPPPQTTTTLTCKLLPPNHGKNEPMMIR